MIRTQIQLPDQLFSQAKEVCQAREISMAELARRGIEYMISIYPQTTDKDDVWNPPTPRSLGWMGLSDAEIKHQAQLTNSQLSILDPPPDDRT
jgi:hypothetical protein